MALNLRRLHLIVWDLQYVHDRHSLVQLRLVRVKLHLPARQCHRTDQRFVCQRMVLELLFMPFVLNASH